MRTPVSWPAVQKDIHDLEAEGVESVDLHLSVAEFVVVNECLFHVRNHRRTGGEVAGLIDGLKLSFNKSVSAEVVPLVETGWQPLSA